MTSSHTWTLCAALFSVACTSADRNEPILSADAGGGGSGVGGGSMASTSSSGATGGGGAGGALPGDSCLEGLYGVDALYFGLFEIEPAFTHEAGVVDPPPAEKTWIGPSHVSPNGLEFVLPHGSVDNVQGCAGVCYKNVWFVRTSQSAPWKLQNGFIQSFWSGENQIFLDDLTAMFACHGGGMKCAVYRRASAATQWPFGYGTDPDIFSYENLAPFDVKIDDGGAVDFWFTPTPDGRHLAFGSNRESAMSDVAQQSAYPWAAIDLWTADAIDYLHPEYSYENLLESPEPSSPVAEDRPSWLSADATTLVYSTRFAEDPTFDVFVTTRADAASPFTGKTKIAILSSDEANEDAFSIPTVVQIEKNGKKATGWIRRVYAGAFIQYERFPVCLGSTNP